MKFGDVVRYLGFGSTEKGPKRILVVGSDTNSLNGIVDELRSSGYQIDFERDCRDYDLALVNMDVDEGFDFLKKTRNVDNTTPIVGVIEQNDAEIFRAYREGADYCIIRPVRQGNALNVVNYLIGDLPEDEKEKLESIL